MEPIRVPRPPKEAFDKNRCVSDLIRKQVEHFRHVESKFSDVQRRDLPQGKIRTEHEAAQYISTMTRQLLSQSAPAAQPRPTPVVIPSRQAKQQPARGLAMAAAEEAQPTPTKSAKKTAPQPRKAEKGRRG